MRFYFTGVIQTDFLQQFALSLRRALTDKGHKMIDEGDQKTRLVFNFCTESHPKAARNRPADTFAAAVIQAEPSPADESGAHHKLFPLVVRTLCNAALIIYNESSDDSPSTFLITLEGGVSPIKGHPHRREYYDRICERIVKLASATEITDNEFHCDMPVVLREGCKAANQIVRASRKLDSLDLMPSPFPIHEVLDACDQRHFERLFGSPGLSYGNLSARHDERRFWISASGVDKTRLRTVGRDILLVKDYDPEKRAMMISRLPDVKPLKASVDTIEHWLIYRENPAVGGILHLHAWMDDIPVIPTAYPCGTYELGQAVADMIAQSPEPSRTAVGLPNHGITITGHSLLEIFERINGKVTGEIPTM